MLPRMWSSQLELKCQLWALVHGKAGYRHIDTAWAYNNEAEIGRALKKLFDEGFVKRKDIFVTTKLFGYFHKQFNVIEGLRESLERLGLDYVDLYLVHGPIAFERVDGWEGMLFPVVDGQLRTDETEHMETWKGMEELFKLRLTKAIGLSNFNSKQIQYIWDHADIKPHNLQVECHAYFPQVELQEFCRSKNITFTAYSPLGSPGRPVGPSNAGQPMTNDMSPLMEHETVVGLAQKYNKTTAQVLLRFLIQREIVVIPKSTNPGRIAKNADIFDFELSELDFLTISRLPHKRLFDFEAAKSHKYYPFGEKF